MMQKQAIKLHTRWNDDGAAADEHDDETGPAKKPGALGAESMAITGDAVEHGPCGFVDMYDPDYVLSASDAAGTYSYQAQPRVCYANLERLVASLRRPLHSAPPHATAPPPRHRTPGHHGPGGGPPRDAHARAPYSWTTATTNMTYCACL